MSAITLDRNQTIWQRIQTRCAPVFGREVADEVARLLLPYVVAERKEALERSGSLVPFHVLNKVGVVNFNDCCCTNVASLNHGGASIGRTKLQGSFGDSHVSPSIEAGVLDTPKAIDEILGECTGTSMPSGVPVSPSGEVTA